MPGISVNDGGTVKTVTGLYVNDNGTVKPVVEAYVNDGGTVKKFWPSIGPPAAVTNLAVTGSSGSTLDLAWSLPADNGSPLTGQTIEWGTDGINFPNSAPVGAAATTCTITGLAAVTLYYVRHRSANAQGNSPYSNVAQGTTLSASFPQAPTLVSRTTGGSGILTIQPGVLQGGGGTPVTYQWEIALWPFVSFTLSGSFARTSADQTATISVPNHASAYKVRVRSVNGAGTSPWSNELIQVSPGPMVNGTQYRPQQDPYDTGQFKDIVYAKNDVANGGNGQVIGDIQPTSVNGLTVERVGRSGNVTITFRLIGANVQQSNFKWFSVGVQGQNTFTFDSANATFQAGLGTAGTINQWDWTGVDPQWADIIQSGAGLYWWVGGPT